MWRRWYSGKFLGHAAAMRSYSARTAAGSTGAASRAASNVTAWRRSAQAVSMKASYENAESVAGFRP